MKPETQGPDSPLEEAGQSPGAGSRPASESVTIRAFQRLQEDIVAGALKPGQKLKIETVCSDYGFGASAVREALSLLTASGLVERIDHRGFKVAEVGLQEFEDILSTRCWLEERALRESIVKGDRAWEEGVVIAYYHLSRMPWSTGKGEYSQNLEWERAHKRFHMSLIANSSPTLLRYCDQLYDRNVQYRSLSEPVAYGSRDMEAEHRQIFEATTRRQADMAVDLLVSHYRKTGDYLRAVLKRRK